MARRVNVKDTDKASASKAVREFFESNGFTVDDGVDYGMTSNTLIIKKKNGTASGYNSDMQVKFITPKMNVTEYEKEAE